MLKESGSSAIADLVSGPGHVPVAHNNNFDLIRLLAAAQVAILHIMEHLEIEAPIFTNLLGLFPGVPIFFFISGFLVSQSLARTPDLTNFYRKRLLRVYPGLWGCLFVSILLVSMFKDLPWTSPSFVAWLLAQITIGQFYNPPFLRDFGIGVLNGSLWTIPVEVQFYVVLPFIYSIVRRFRSKWWLNLVLAAFLAHAVFLGAIYGQQTLLAKLLQVSLIPWLSFFLMGTLAAHFWPRIAHLFEGNAIYWLAFYIAGTAAIGWFTPFAIRGNAINGGSALLCFGVVLSAAFTARNVSRRLLRGNDISYGLYLYHLPLMNAYLAADPDLPGPLGAIIIFASAVVFAIFSWLVVERPSLRLKQAASSKRARTGAAVGDFG